MVHKSLLAAILAAGTGFVVLTASIDVEHDADASAPGLPTASCDDICCGGTPTSFSAGEIVWGFGQGPTQAAANRMALGQVVGQLLTLSGVSCPVCESLVPCPSVVNMLGGESVVPGPMVGDEFTAVATFAGHYTVRCASCPPEV